MANVKLNKNTFTIIIGIMIAVMIIMAGILIVNFAAPGLISGISGIFSENEPIIEEDETGPWGEKVYSWSYRNADFQTQLSISKEAYKNSSKPIGGYDLAGYIVDDETQTIRILAGNMEQLAAEQSLSDRDTVFFVVSFVQALTYEPDTISGHAANYPRTPTVTLAEGIGDSKDLSILASAILNEMGYAVALLNYPDINLGGVYVPGAAAIAVPGENTVVSPVYRISSGQTTRPLEVIWIADTASLGFPEDAYFIEEPEIIPASGFWNGRIIEKPEAILPTDELYQIPDLDINLDVSSNSWEWNAEQFYEKKWYDTSISWTSKDAWVLREHLLTVTPMPDSEPSKDGVLPGSLWRLSYTVTPTIPLVTDDGRYADMTPFSSADIAIYDMSSGDPVLIETLGWQGTHSADKPQTSPVYPPGKYAIGIFVRNADVKITVQCSDNLNEVIYTGGI